MKIFFNNMNLRILLLTLLIGNIISQEYQLPQNEILTSILDSLPEDIPTFMQKTASFLRLSENKEDTTQQMKKEGYFCSSCKSLFNTLQQYQLTPMRFTISEFMGLMCKYYWKQDHQVCDDAVKTNGKIVLDSLQKRYLDADLICPMLNLCPQIYESVDIRKLIKEIIEDKPKNVEPTKPKKEKIAKIIHMTDLHFDRKYAVDSNAQCLQPTCCRENSGVPQNETSKAGFWGSVANCDLPFRTIEATVSFIKRNFTEGEIDFIIWTGDSTNHFIWEQTQEENINNTLKITELFQKQLPNLPVIPVMGNHESYPCNVYDYKSDRENKLNQVFADAWEYWIGKEAAQQYREFGFYSTNQTKLGNKLRIIALNTQAGNPFNWFLLQNPTDPGNQLAWMRQELLKAEQNGESVYIIGHIPSDETIDDWADIYSAIVERYSHIIRGQFYGHTHTDHFKIYFNNNTTEVNNVALITSSLTTYGGLNPSFRLIELDSDTFQLLNYKQYRLNLTYYNQNKIRDVSLVNFDIAYDFNNLYGYNDMSDIQTWQDLSLRLKNDLETYQNFQHHYNSGTESKSQFPEIDSTVYCSLYSTPRLAANCNNQKYTKNFYESLIGSWFSEFTN